MTGSVLLHKGFRAKGLVQLIGARIEGDLVCEKGAVFEGDEHYALVAARCVVTGKVRLGEDFHAHKSVNFTDARIATGFDGCGAWFEGRTGASLVLDRAQVSGPLLLRALQSKLANASFVGAKVTELDDDEQTWGENLALNGFVYGALSARAPVSPKIRSAWLRQQIPSLEKDRPAAELAKDFRPQPWRQLQRVLVEMGHAGEARELGIIYEQQLRAIGHVGQPPSGWPTWIAAIYSRIALGLHALYGLLTGYGYRPMQLLFWFVGIWLSCASVFWYAAAQHGVFAPSDPLVFQNPAYLDCRPDRGQAWRLVNPGQETDPSFYGQGNWYLCDSLREEYTGFSPLAYSLDVLMPLVDLQQEADWAPLVPTPKQGFWDEFTAFGWKHFVRLLIWFEVLVGWGISLLMVAIVSGLARRSE
ncbi:membrane-associated oxidoreductase [Pseudomonas sp.]